MPCGCGRREREAGEKVKMDERDGMDKGGEMMKYALQITKKKINLDSCFRRNEQAGLHHYDAGLE